MNKLLHQTPGYLILLASITVISTFSALGFYAYPSADDFCMASGVRDSGLWPHLWRHYLEWSGRYAGNAFYAIYPLLFGLMDGYDFIALSLIILLILATAYFVAKLFRLSMSVWPVWLVSFAFVCVYLLGLRHTASSLYWLAGALSYQTANILLLFTLGLMIELIHRQREKRSAFSVVVLLMFAVFLGMGSNETNMVTLTAVLTVALLFHVREDWRVLNPWLGLFIIGLLCFLLVYFAPGNALRESTFPLRHDWVRSIDGSMKMGWWTLVVWTGNPVFMVTTLLVPFAALKFNSLSPYGLLPGTNWLILLFTSTLCMPFVLQFPAWWSMGGWPPPRTVDAIFFVFLLSWVLLIGGLSLRFIPQALLFSDKGGFNGKAVTGYWVLMILFIGSIAINSKFHRAQDDLWKKTQAFDLYMQDRHARIDQAKNQGGVYVVVPAFKQDFPYSIYFNDIRADYRDWRNMCYARYFRIQGIAQEKPRRIKRQ